MCKILSKSEPSNFATTGEKKLGRSQRIVESFTQKIVIMLSKIFVWDPGSGSATLKDINISYSLES
jgi:hypothetical protein